MTQSYEDWYEENKHKPPYFYPKKKDLPELEFKIRGPHGKTILFKDEIGLNYFSTTDDSIIYIEDISPDKQLSLELSIKDFQLHLCYSRLYIDFNTDYYYILYEFEDFNQYNYINNNKKITLALLNEDKSDIINKWTKSVNLL